ncbi:MAG: sulfatase-like hydrolase/transferase [Vicinamibacterales bacterium]
MHLAFALLTAAYCLLTYNAFAYRQFIKPHLVVWLTDFVIWHHAWYWLVLALTAATLWPELRTGIRGRAVGLAYLTAASIVGAALAIWPVLPQVENDWRGLIFAAAALVPPVWLAVYDHLAATGSPPRSLPQPPFAHEAALAVRTDPRLGRAWLLAGAVLWLIETIEAPWLLTRTGEIVLTMPRLALGAAMSALAHAVACSAAALATLAALRLSRRIGVEYSGIVILWILGLTVGITHVVFGGLAFTGPTAWAVAAWFATTLAVTWSGLARRWTADCHEERPRAPIETWLAPLPGIRSRGASMAALIVLMIGGALLMKSVEPLDWDFLFQKSIVLASLALTLGYAYGVLPDSNDAPRWPSLTTAPAIGVIGATLLVATPRLPAWTGQTDWVPEFALEGYVAVAPSFHLLHDILRIESDTDAAFFRHLRDNSTLQHVEVPPLRIDFVPASTAAARPVTPQPGTRPPHIFLFVVDSLRRDYLSPYNPAVSFTPAFGTFARDSIVFERAFTRYGGTGLSVPAVWAGGMLFHKQYVTPFAPMNALMKLLDSNGYRRIMSMDSVVAQIMPADTPAVELDRGVSIVDYSLCRTLGELRGILEREAPGQPLFVYTLPQNLHIGQVRSKPVPPGRAYDGFVAPVAAEVERIDACFGAFLDDLRRLDLYDESIVIVTADHGDSLGEARRWGHSYTMFPEVVRIPLLIHLPSRLRSSFHVDPARVALSTDITPSLYALLGRAPADLGPLFGTSLFRTGLVDGHPDRRDAILLASSYGAVYAVLRRDGRWLYIADGVNNREYAYDLSADRPVRVGVTDHARTENRTLIRSELARLARTWTAAGEP